MNVLMFLFDKCKILFDYMVDKFSIFGYVINFGIVIYAFLIISWLGKKLFLLMLPKNKREIWIYKHDDKIKASDKYEKRVCRRFKHAIKGVTLQNVILPGENGSTEVDAIHITKKGIFCIEAKRRKQPAEVPNLSLEYEYCEVACINNEKKVVEREMMYNPFLQNRGHVKAIEGVIGESYKIYNTVVINFDSNFSYLGRNQVTDDRDGSIFMPGDNMILMTIDIKLDDHVADGTMQLRRDLKKQKELYTDEEVKQIVDKLKPYVATASQRAKFAKSKGFGE